MKPFYRQESTKCGKPTCKKCPHGPYWYEYSKDRKGLLKKRYVGKSKANVPYTADYVCALLGGFVVQDWFLFECIGGSERFSFSKNRERYRELVDSLREQPTPERKEKEKLARLAWKELYGDRR